MSDHQHQVVVVGGGPAGLATASLLRRDGIDAVVVDAHPGGRARTDERRGFSFNRGPHAVYLGGPAHQVLTHLGLQLEGGYPKVRPHGVLDGVVHPLPTGGTSLLRSPVLGWKGRASTARLLQKLPSIDPAPLADRSFGAWLDELGMPADAQRLVRMLARVSTYAAALDVASADMVVRQVQMAMANGVRYVHGGWQRIVDSLTGGTPPVPQQVLRVERDGDRVVTHLADESRIVSAAAVVATGTPSAAAALLDRTVWALGPEIEATCLDLGVTGHADPAQLFGLDDALYLSDHGLVAQLAPEGHSVVHVARYLMPGEAGSRDDLERHAAIAGLTGDRIVEARYLARMTVAGALTTPEHGGLAGRPAVDASGVDGVFLAGDWVGHVGHLLDASLASAEAAATAAARAVTLVTR